MSRQQRQNWRFINRLWATCFPSPSWSKCQFKYSKRFHTINALITLYNFTQETTIFFSETWPRTSMQSALNFKCNKPIALKTSRELPQEQHSKPKSNFVYRNLTTTNEASSKRAGRYRSDKNSPQAVGCARQDVPRSGWDVGCHRWLGWLCFESKNGAPW